MAEGLRGALLVAVVGLFVLVFGVGSAFAGGVWWGLTSGSWPANLTRSEVGVVVVTAQNRG